MLDDVVVDDATRMHSPFNARMILILSGIAVEFFVPYAHVACEILQGVGCWKKRYQPAPPLGAVP